MSQKHTPGPWNWRYVGTHGYVIEAAGRHIGGSILYANDGGKANACLMSAAPDLLDVLQRMLDHGERCNWFADRGDYELVAEAQAAVAKATHSR